MSQLLWERSAPFHASVTICGWHVGNGITLQDALAESPHVRTHFAPHTPPLIPSRALVMPPPSAVPGGGHTPQSIHFVCHGWSFSCTRLHSSKSSCLTLITQIFPLFPHLYSGHCKSTCSDRFGLDWGVSGGQARCVIGAVSWRT